ncbi:MAG TPA: efflux RND transporter permease subunit, partial [Pirellulales bacterium]|nr:efflux RND transporter permease subunit [Pirellulales bacterium]
RGGVTATIRDQRSPQRWLHGEAVLGLGFARMGESSYVVTHELRDAFSELMPSIEKDLAAEGASPADVQVVVAYDRTDLVNRVIDTVSSNLLEGACMVVLILYMFLGNLRAGLICAVAIPLSMMVGFCGMWWMGIAGSLLSLGAIDFGVVVDSSIVMVDHIVHALSGVKKVTGTARVNLVRRASVEVRTPAVFGQLIIMIVYLPILTLEGVEGRMFRPMALTVIFVLVGSLLCSLTVTPVLASFVLPARAQRDVWLIRVSKRLYIRLLKRVLRWRVATVTVAVLTLGACGWLASRLGTEFVPRLDEGTIVIGIARPPGTSLEEGMRINQRMERQLVTQFPDEVDYAWSRAGSPEVPTDASTVEMTDLFVALRPRHQWTKAATQVELVKQFEEAMRDAPGQVVWYTQPIEQRTNELISGARGDVAIKLFGEDFDELARTAGRIAQVLRTVPGCHDVTTEQMLGQPILRIDIDQEEIARYGVPVQQLMDIVESVGGKHVGEVIEGTWRFPLMVRLPEAVRASAVAIADILVESPEGGRIPLSALASVRIERGPRLISREWSKRRALIQFNVRDRDVGSAVYDAQRRIASAVTLPAGYRIEWGGQFENMRRAQRRLAFAGPVALALIVVLL